jgi:hypothetical protein
MGARAISHPHCANLSTIQFYSTSDQLGEVINLSASFVGEPWEGQNGRCFSKGRHNDWTGSLVICGESEQRCLVVLGNSVRTEIVFPEVAALVVAKPDFPSGGFVRNCKLRSEVSQPPISAKMICVRWITE